MQEEKRVGRRPPARIEPGEPPEETGAARLITENPDDRISGPAAPPYPPLHDEEIIADAVEEPHMTQAEVFRDPADFMIDAPALEPPKSGWFGVIYLAKFFWRRRESLKAPGTEPQLYLVMCPQTYVEMGREIAETSGVGPKAMAFHDAWMERKDTVGPVNGIFYGMPVWILPCMRGLAVLKEEPWKTT